MPVVTIQRPDSLSLSGNMNDFVLQLQGISSIIFFLKVDGQTILQETYYPGNGGVVRVKLKEVIESYLSVDIPNEISYMQQNLSRTFTAEYGLNPYDFRVVLCGVDDFKDSPSGFLRNNFLTWQPQLKEITYYSPEYITFFAVENCRLRLYAEFPDGSSETLTLINNATAGTAYTHDMQYAVIAGLLGNRYPGRYKVWTETSAGVRLSREQGYVATQARSRVENWFVFANSLGGLDCMRAYGSDNYEPNYEHNIAEIDGVSEDYRVDTERLHTRNTGRLTKDESSWLQDFFPSRKKWHHTPTGFRSIIVTDQDASASTTSLPGDYSFTYRYADEKPYLNLSRTQLLPDNLSIPDPGTSELFFLPPRLAEFPRLLSRDLLLPANDSHGDMWGATVLGALLNEIVEDIIRQLEGVDMTGGGYGVDIIKLLDLTEPSDQNVFSSLRSINEFISKKKDDTANGLIQFIKGIDIGKFTSGPLGSGGCLKMIPLPSQNPEPGSGDSYLEVDKLFVRKEATFTTLNIHELRAVGGAVLVTLGDMTITEVDIVDSGFKCYFDSEDGTIPNYFVVNDQARCQKFDGKNLKYYWRLVVEVGSDYVILSDTDKDGNGTPAKGDELIQLGHRTNADRQSALMLTSFGNVSPAMIQYEYIDTYDLNGKEGTRIASSRNGSKFVGSLYVVSGNQNIRVPADKGQWTDTIYNYYDRVSHNGSLWLCIAIPSTNIEPSDSAISQWLKQVEKGGKGDAGEKGDPAVIISLTNEFHSLPSDANGNVSSFAGANTTVRLYKGGSLLVSDITYSFTRGAGVSGTSSGDTFTLTGLSRDASYVDCVAVYNDNTYTARFSISKTKQGNTGNKGEDSTSYRLFSNSEIILVKNISFTPERWWVYPRQQTGDSEETYPMGCSIRIKGYKDIESTAGDILLEQTINSAAYSVVPTTEYLKYTAELMISSTGSLLDMLTAFVQEDTKTVKDDMSQQLGFNNYDDFVFNAKSKGTLYVEGGYLNVDLIETKALFTEAVTAEIASISGTTINENGVIMRPTDSLKNLSISPNPLPLLSSFLEDGSFSGTLSLPAIVNQQQTARTASFEAKSPISGRVKINNVTTLKYSSFTVDMTASHIYNIGTYISIGVTFVLESYSSSSAATPLGELGIPYVGYSTYDSNGVTRRLSIPGGEWNIPSETTHIGLKAYYHVTTNTDGSATTYTLSASIAAGQYPTFYGAGVQKSVLALDGYGLALNKDNYFHLKANDPDLTLSFKGIIDSGSHMTGLLLQLILAPQSNGVAAIYSKTGRLAENIGTSINHTNGQVTVTHNYGKGNYRVIFGTMDGDHMYAHSISAISNNAFTVKFAGFTNGSAANTNLNPQIYILMLSY